MSEPTLITKVAPQSLEAEKAVLGACLLDSRHTYNMVGILKREHFYDPANQLVFEAILRLHNKNHKVELIGLVNELKSMQALEEIGGPFYLTKLTDNVSATYAMEQHCAIIIGKYLKRETGRIAAELLAASFDDSKSEDDLQHKAESELFALYNQISAHQFVNIQDAIVAMIKQIDAARANDGGLIGVPTGYFEINTLTGGWRKSDLIILAARPGMGKSILAACFAVNAALDQNKAVPVGIFSLEMSVAQYTARMVSNISEIEYSAIDRGRVDDATMSHLHRTGIQRLLQAEIYIDDTASINIYQLESRARRMKAKHGIGLLIIDYLQLMQGIDKKGQNREQEIATISRRLKTLAKELNVPIIALSQLSRETEKGDRTPKLSHLRESGAIEQDADVVMFIHQPDLDSGMEGEDGFGYTKLIFAKHRSGEKGEIELKAKFNFMKFARWEGSSPTTADKFPPRTFHKPKKEELPF